MAVNWTIRIAFAAQAVLAAAASASAAVIDGKITFPGSDAPAMTAYVYEVGAARLRSAPISADGTNFRFDVPAGRYVVFVAPREPGAPDVYGAYTQYSDCIAHASTGACTDHDLRPVVLGHGVRHVDVRIDDWYLSDADADRLDGIRGIAGTPGPAPQGAPRFSEYAVVATDHAALRKPDIAGLALDACARARLRDSVRGGPNFAGRVTALQAACGSARGRILLVDWQSGKAVAPPALAGIDETLPCRSADAVQFRRDSRLLSVTRMRAGRIVTQYYLWEPETASVALIAEYRRRRREFCAVDPP